MKTQLSTLNSNVPERTHEVYIKVAADSCATLRKVDVMRVLEGVQPDNIDGITRHSLAAWIKTERPDLADEVDEVMSELDSSNSKSVTAAPLFVRTVAQALERHMSAKEESRMHWAQPAGYEVSWKPPKMHWPATDYPDLGYLIKRGGNEGYQVWVTHQPDPSNCSLQQPLIIIKCLTSYAETFNQARMAMEFFESMNTEALLKSQ